jgi:hypothetical protein
LGERAGSHAGEGNREPGVDALMRVYAKCVAGQQDEAKRRILDATKATRHVSNVSPRDV